MPPTISEFASASNQLPEAPPATDISPERFGRDAAALANLGGDIGEFGSKLMAARKQAEEADAVMRANHDDIAWRAETEETVRQEFTTMNADGTVSLNKEGFAEKMRSLSEDRIKEGVKVMPTGDAQRSYIARSGGMFTNAYASDLTWEGVEKAKIWRKNGDQVMNAGIIQVGTNPSLFTLSNVLENAGNWINESTAAPINGNQKAEMYRTKGKEMVYAYFDGLSRTKSGSEQGLNVLNSLTAAGGPTVMAYTSDGKIQTHNMKDSSDHSYLYNFLDHKDVEHFRDKLSQKKSTMDTVARNNLRANLTDVVNKMEAGQWEPADDINTNAYIQSLRGHVDDSKPGYTNRNYQDDVLAANVAKVSSQFMQVAAGLPANQKNAADVKIDAFIQNSMEETGVPESEWKQRGFAIRQGFEKKRDALFSSLVKQREADPVGYIQKYKLAGANIDLTAVSSGRPMSNGEANSILQAQADLGIPAHKQRLLSNNSARLIADSIKNSQNPAAAGQQLLNIQTGSGKMSRRYMDELVRHGKLPEKYRAATMLENPEYAKTFVDTLKNKDAKNVLNAQGRKDEEKRVVEEAQKQFKEYFGSIAGSGAYYQNSEAALAIQETVAARARLSVSNNEANPKEAVSQAMSELVKSSFDLRQGSLVPRSIGGKPIDGRRVEGEMKWRKSLDYLRNRIDIPNGPDPVNEAAKMTKALGNSRWNPNVDQSGATLEIKNNKNKWVPVFGKDKKPITVDYLEADQNTSSEGLKLAPSE